MKFTTVHSETLLKGRVFTIRRDEVALADGRTTHFDIVEHHGSVVILPVDQDGNLVLVRQYRHAAGRELLELPAGTLEPDEDPFDCAQREIREETGLAARTWQKIGSFYLAPGYSTENMHVYLATDLYPAPLQPDEYEFLHVERIPLAEIQQAVAQGLLPDAKSLAALYLASPYFAKL
jgi:ADP-ribose pyrophosphatase